MARPPRFLKTSEVCREQVQQLEAELEELRTQQQRRSKRRIQFEFAEDTYQYLQKEARRNNTSMAMVIRDALGKKRWLDQKISSGSLLLEEGGEIRRVVGL